MLFRSGKNISVVTRNRVLTVDLDHHAVPQLPVHSRSPFDHQFIASALNSVKFFHLKYVFYNSYLATSVKDENRDYAIISKNYPMFKFY